MLGMHLIKTWSVTQSVVSLSSGEAEYYGLVKGASVGLGIRSMLKTSMFHQILLSTLTRVRQRVSQAGVGLATYGT